jgi:uracil-DNA glycosylase family 4
VNNLQDCQLCPRLAAYREELKRQYPDYHCAPVAAMGDIGAALFIVGLAPGLHGANASGRPFTGDASGDLLFATLHHYGFARQPDSRTLDSEQQLLDCRITNAVKCVPPQNKPLSLEINTCNRFLRTEIKQLPSSSIVLTLGAIAHRAVIRALGLQQSAFPFQHGAQYSLQDDEGSNIRQLFTSYHPSRYNVNTGKITAASFARVFASIREVLP